MKIPVIISPSQQFDNPCKFGDTEAYHCRVIADKLFDNLTKDDRFVVYVVPIIKNKDYLRTICDISNSFITANGGKGYHISLHTDAFEGKSFGATTFYYSAGGESEKLAKAIHNEITKLTPWQDRQCIARPGLFELNSTNASSVLVELSFHDEYEQAKWIHEHMSEIANALTAAIYTATGLEVKKLNWREIIQSVSSNTQEWETAINKIVEMTNSCNLGEIDVLKYLPQLIEKIYNAKK